LTAGKFLASLLAGILALFVVIGGCAAATSFKGVDTGEICVVKEGGPFDGRDIKEVRQPASGPKFIGPFNSQHCFPSNERSYTLSSDAGEADSKTVDVFKTPTVDAVEVYVEGQSRFALNTDPEVVEEFYRRYGNRTYDGKRAHDGGEGWENFLAQVYRPVLLNALRDAIGEYRCVELKNTCQYVQNTEAVTEGKVEEVANSQNLSKVETEVAKQVESNINSQLGGEFFVNVRFNLTGVKFEDAVDDAVTRAQTKRTEVANTRLEAERLREEAAGKKLAAREDAQAIKIKQDAYQTSPTQADIDKIRALCGEGGCQNLQILGEGNVTKLVR
jgi:regulator of protease activity HflC (stomatin/prohibitin superfamily)